MSLRKLLACLSVTICLCVSLWGASAVVFAESSAFENTISTKVEKFNNEMDGALRLDRGTGILVHLFNTDYMDGYDGWKQGNWNWKNAEEPQYTCPDSVDFEKENYCNFTFDKNLTEYNFEEYIFFDGVSLKDFKTQNPYTLVGNKRARPNTFCIDFAVDNRVLDSVDMVEIRKGCEIPTLSFACRGLTEKSRILIEETIKFVKNPSGEWVEYFEGYQEGVEYEGTEKTFNLTLDDTYKGHTAVKADSYSDFFTKYEIQGQKLDHRALVTLSNTAKGNLIVLSLVNPIDASEFNKIKLKVYVNHEVVLNTYNANDVTTESKGDILETVTVPGGQFSYITLSSVFYKNSDGKVDTIIFECAEDFTVEKDDGQGNVIRDTFFFIALSVANEDVVTSESLKIENSDSAYIISVRFNKNGLGSQPLDTDKICFNGLTATEIIESCQGATCEWQPFKTVYQIVLTLPKTYDGEAKVKNVENDYTGNKFTVSKGLVFPNGDVLSKTYVCNVYAGETIVDTELVEKYGEVSVQGIYYGYVSGSENIHFAISFNKNVTSMPYYHASQIERWRSTEPTLLKNGLYDAGSSTVYVKGGFKTSLLDLVVINGKTIGEWHAFDKTALTNVQVHYGNSGLSYLDVFIEKVSPNTYDGINQLVKSGNGITIEIKSGLKFMTNVETKNDKKFVLTNGKFVEQMENEQLSVYFDGAKVENGATVTANAPTSKGGVSVEGVLEYTISESKEKGKTIYTVTYGENKVFTFTVVEDYDLGLKNGALLWSLLSVILSLGVVGVGIVLILNKKKKEKGETDEK
ncbi:MAG: hypothetical protein IJW64_06690 [Clostridia bacterium]|nr:hypothetical protein [Clostridia bacterium]